MTKETMQNIVDSIVLGELETYYYLTSETVVHMFEPYCENSEDLDEVLEFIFNSKKYNYILFRSAIWFAIVIKSSKTCTNVAKMLARINPYE